LQHHTYLQAKTISSSTHNSRGISSPPLARCPGDCCRGFAAVAQALVRGASSMLRLTCWPMGAVGWAIVSLT
jgi:hypothetical protein